MYDPSNTLWMNPPAPGARVWGKGTPLALVASSRVQGADSINGGLFRCVREDCPDGPIFLLRAADLTPRA